MQELELEQQPALQERKHKIQEALLDPEDGTQGAPPDPGVRTRKALSTREDETQEVPLDPEETQGTPSDPKEETLEVPSDPEEETLEAPSDIEEETLKALLDPEKTQKAPPDSEEETRGVPSDSNEETNDVAGLAAGSTDLEGPIVPARRKLTISANLPPNNVIAHVESTGARRRERSSAAKFSGDE